MTREAVDVCLRVLKESNKSRFDSYSVRNSVLIIRPILHFEIVACTFFPTTFLEIAVYQTRILQQVCVNRKLLFPGSAATHICFNSVSSERLRFRKSEVLAYSKKHVADQGAGERQRARTPTVPQYIRQT